jgi:hypothetical protein
MTYLLLLALVVTAGFVTYYFTQAFRNRSLSKLFFGIGFIFLGLGLISQLVLGFDLDESAAKWFYWARGSMTLAWLGMGMLPFIPRLRPFSRWIIWAVVAASLAMFALDIATHITATEGWYSVARPVYGQIGDLLATNRPTRWGALALNLFGVGMLVFGAFSYRLRSDKRQAPNWLGLALITVGAVGLFVPLYWPPLDSSLLFYLSELAVPIAMFVGLNALASQNSPTEVNGRRRG